MNTKTNINNQQIAELLFAMEQNAEKAPILELSLTNWIAEFGQAGIVETPVGTVKMGENQYNKIIKARRETEFGMIKPTLEKPDIVLEKPTVAKTGDTTERPSSLLFIKTFHYGGNIVKFFMSVTVSKEEKEVVVSNHIVTQRGFENNVKKSVIIYINERLIPNSSD